MKFIIKNIDKSVHEVMRIIGYHPAYFQEGKEISVVRPLGKNGYPRFHLHIYSENHTCVFKLHLDQKKPSYKGFRAHSGEHHSREVHKEAGRIKNLLSVHLVK